MNRWKRGLVVCGMVLAACGGKAEPPADVKAGNEENPQEGCIPYCGEFDEAEGGGDGCGGSGGEWEEGAVCGEADYDDIGICFKEATDCPTVCEDWGNECGPAWTGLMYPEMCDCGECPQGLVCIEEYDGNYCDEPDCEDEECPESPGCFETEGLEGGLGFPCGADEECLFELCLAPGGGERICTCPCEDDFGCPDGFSCEMAADRIPDMEFACFPSCAPGCLGKECGDDGCGGSCGECEGETVCQGGQCLPPYWTDPVSGLTWQNPAAPDLHDQNLAVFYCDKLEWGGYSDWHLPTIDELRSLIRGCPDTETGGACGVTDSCYETSCFNPDLCFSCPYDVGPADGCYWPDEMLGPCEFYWSAMSPYTSYAWYVSFRSGRVANGTWYDGYVRCVR